MSRFGALLWFCSALYAADVPLAQRIKVSYVDGTLGIALNTAGNLDYRDEQTCTITWARGAEQSRFSYDSIAFIEKGALHMKGVYEPISLVNKWLEFVTIAYIDDWGRTHLLELRLKSGAEPFLNQLSLRSHRAINHGPIDASPIAPNIGRSLNGSLRRVTIRSTTWTNLPEGSAGTLSLPNTTTIIIEAGAQKLELAYGAITAMEYGEKVSSGWLRAVAVSALCLNELPFFLMRKQHRHFLTIDFTDDRGSPQAVQVELSKYRSRILLLELELRSGKRVTYQSEQAAQEVYG